MTIDQKMCTPRASSAWILLLPFLLLVPLAASQATTKWQTLSGGAPVIVARGGFSGILPDSSIDAYTIVSLTSAPDVVLWCDVQLTKDGIGLCAPDVNLNNSTDIQQLFPNNNSTYKINGVSQNGWFSVDFTYEDLQAVSLVQGMYSRSQRFDGNNYQIQRPEDVVTKINQSTAFWLNIQHDAFFLQHNLSARSYVLSVTRKLVLSHISSPEVAFLKSMASRFNPKITKLILRFLEPEDIEPTTNQTYSSLLHNLKFIKTFASGILVPKYYVWPVDASGYLQPHTSLVTDAHKAGLEVYTSEFYNDVPFNFNCSYDPVTEYLYHMDNGDFSVDGVLSDFPITPSEARDCFAHLQETAADQVNLTIITKNGASGDYTGGTDLAYQKAITDGADVIDCSVQISQDNVPFCMSSINLIDSTNVIQSRFGNLQRKIPDLGSGIFSFSLNWSQIQSLTPMIANPYARNALFRNPKYKNAGKFLTLSDFLNMAKNSSSLSGVLISIENAAYLTEKQNVPVIDLVLGALKNAGYDDQPVKKVMIQSTNSAVLMKFKGTTYELVYAIREDIGDALSSAVDDIKSFAHSVVVSKSSVMPEYTFFLKRLTDVVPELRAANLSVYVETFSNEFISQAWDFFSDATVELNTYATTDIIGVVTDFPRTSARYKKNQCLNKGENTPIYMSPIKPGALLSLIQYPPLMPPAEAPNPTLTERDVEGSPLADPTIPTPGPAAGNTTGTKSSAGRLVRAATVLLTHFALVIIILLQL